MTIKYDKTLDELRDQDVGAGGGAAWGGITGSITDQADLVNYVATAIAPVTLTWAQLIALSGSYIAGTTYQTSDAPDGSTTIVSIQIKALSANNLAIVGDGIVTRVSLFFNCKIRFNWTAGAGARIVGYSDEQKNEIEVSDNTTATLDTWLAAIPGSYYGIKIRGAAGLGVSGGTFSNGTTIGYNTSISLVAGTFLGGTIGANCTIVLVGTQSITNCEFGDGQNFFGNLLNNNAYTATGKVCRKGFSDFIVTDTDLVTLVPGGISDDIDCAGASFAGYLMLAGPTLNPIRFINNGSDQFPQYIQAYFGLIELMDQATAGGFGGGNIHLNQAIQTIPINSRFQLSRRSTSSDMEQTGINIPYLS